MGVLLLLTRHAFILESSTLDQIMRLGLNGQETVGPQDGYLPYRIKEFIPSDELGNWEYIHGFSDKLRFFESISSTRTSQNVEMKTKLLDLGTC